MASVNDYGKDELANLGAPKLGGPDGWAEAVAKVVNNSDVTMDDRIYNAISSSPRGSRWLWGGQDADIAPLPGHFAIESTGGSNRKFAMSVTDADGLGRSAATLMAGDTITVTDDPAAPPVTGFARYVIVDDPVEHAGYWTWNAIRTDTSGSQTSPPLNTSLRMNATWSSAGASASTPIGAVIAYGGQTAPDGWHLCDGTPHGSPTLEALIGSANAPDLRGKFVLAASATHLPKTTGGAETHTLTEAEMPSHDHNGATSGMSANQSHAHSFNVYTSETYLPGYAGAGANSGQGAAITSYADIAHTHGIAPKGGGGAHNNMPPFYALVYIIKRF